MGFTSYKHDFSFVNIHFQAINFVPWIIPHIAVISDVLQEYYLLMHRSSNHLHIYLSNTHQLWIVIYHWWTIRIKMVQEQTPVARHQQSTKVHCDRAQLAFIYLDMKKIRCLWRDMQNYIFLIGGPQLICGGPQLFIWEPPDIYLAAPLKWLGLPTYYLGAPSYLSGGPHLII